MNRFILFLTTIAMFTVMSCGTEAEKDEKEGEKDEAKTEIETKKKDAQQMSPAIKKNGLTVYRKTNSPEFDDATLTTTAPVNDAVVDAGEVKFTYDISNYELGVQTDKKDGLANSGDGQHIHAILNNQPYMAKYNPEFSTDLEDGHYVLLSFLSRSYHESVKSDGAYDLITFTVGDGEAEEVDLNAPHLFYSRPKGTYEGDAAQKILLDWYLVNCDLSKDGHRVRATINGTEFTFDDWAPYVVEGLPMGEVTVKIELLDADGNLVDSPFNPEERTVTLKSGE